MTYPQPRPFAGGSSPVSTDDDLVVGPSRRVSDEAYRRLYDAIVTGYFEPGSHVEHAALIDAIEKRDAALARRLNQEHVERAWNGVAARFRQAGP